MLGCIERDGEMGRGPAGQISSLRNNSPISVNNRSEEAIVAVTAFQ